MVTPNSNQVEQFKYQPLGQDKGESPISTVTDGLGKAFHLVQMWWFFFIYYYYYLFGGGEWWKMYQNFVLFVAFDNKKIH